MLQPNKIARTVYPDQPAKDFNEFMAHNAKTTTAAVVDDYKERFDALWAAFKRDIQRNSDSGFEVDQDLEDYYSEHRFYKRNSNPKVSSETCPKCQVAESNSTIHRPTPAYP